MTDPMERNGARKRTHNWSEGVEPARDYELQAGESIESVDLEMRDGEGDYNIWEPGKKGQGIPARFRKDVKRKNK